MVESRLEWIPFIISKYYKILVTQNDKTTFYSIETSNECKQITDILVLPDILSYIYIYGYNEDPTKKGSSQAVNDIYRVNYTVKIDDANTYTYENIITTRRKDKEINGDVIYETRLIEGVCLKT
jgi:hypothetical protein